MSGTPSPDAPPPADRPGPAWPEEAPWVSPGRAAPVPRPRTDGRMAGPDGEPASARKTSASWAAPSGGAGGRFPAIGNRRTGGSPGRSLARTDPVSMAALVTGVLPTGPVAVVLGVLGIRRTGRGRRPGRALAVTGLVLGLAWTMVAVAAGGTLLRGPALEGDVSEPVGMASAHLREGNCVRNLPPGGEVRRVSLVPCADPHTAQVFHVGALEQAAERPEDAYEEGRLLCADASTSVRLGEEDVTIVTLVPTSGTSPVVCLVEWPTPVPTDLVN